jgi:hypothetical protein
VRGRVLNVTVSNIKQSVIRDNKQSRNSAERLKKMNFHYGLR